ncbi:hypothetical protein BDN72DRAFT_839404 [Pluteus cervinus]|uniref:Uncharacterized protein n=1 Tax=Pluteus cervinus TaxID=181527 RepID=A0ACD3AWV3_9AGAR|nr:hypothetical protein BDN72DRAFT_839404 [Pluteus cervinus]
MQHPFLDLVREDPFCQGDQVISRGFWNVARKTSIYRAGKCRPCLIDKRHEDMIYLMGTMGGVNPDQLDTLTQHFLIPIDPTPSNGDFSLQLMPPSLKCPSWVVCCPFNGCLDDIQGAWCIDVVHPRTKEMFSAPQCINPVQLTTFRQLCDDRWASFRNMEHHAKRPMVLDFLDKAKARTIRSKRSKRTRSFAPSFAPASSIYSYVTKRFG